MCAGSMYTAELQACRLAAITTLKLALRRACRDKLQGRLVHDRSAGTPEAHVS
jgi:hypothetical protein